MYTATGKTEKNEKNELLTLYMPMVKRLAHHMMGRLPPSVEEDDMVQAGMIGLLDAISRYDVDQSAQFEAYAIQRIRGSMIDELRHSDWMPRSARQSMRKIEKAISALQHQLGRQPSESEIARFMNLPLDRTRTIPFSTNSPPMKRACRCRNCSMPICAPALSPGSKICPNVKNC